jgi:hypothetical protein
MLPYGHIAISRYATLTGANPLRKNGDNRSKGIFVPHQCTEGCPMAKERDRKRLRRISLDVSADEHRMIKIEPARREQSMSEFGMEAIRPHLSHQTDGEQ